jgi:hypothetical protein
MTRAPNRNVGKFYRNSSSSLVSMVLSRTLTTIKASHVAFPLAILILTMHMHTKISRIAIAVDLQIAQCTHGVCALQRSIYLFDAISFLGEVHVHVCANCYNYSNFCIN